MSSDKMVTKSEVQQFKEKCQVGHNELKSLLVSISRNLEEGRPIAQDSQQRAPNSVKQFEGILPHPKSGRSSKQSSFVNVADSLKSGIATHNDQLTST